MAIVEKNADSLRAGTQSRVRALRAPACAALDCDQRYGSEGNYAVADTTASLINHWLENTKFLITPEAAEIPIAEEGTEGVRIIRNFRFASPT